MPEHSQAKTPAKSGRRPPRVTFGRGRESLAPRPAGGMGYTARQLQQTHGNQAVLQMIAGEAGSGDGARGSGAPAPARAPADRSAATSSTLTELGALLDIAPASVPVDDSEAGTRVARRHGSAGVVSGGTIHLDAGRYDPKKRLGRHMLGHEMAHVAQQRLPGSAPLAAAEHEAGAFADAFAFGGSVPSIETPLAATAQPAWYPPGEGAAEHPDQTQISPNGFVVEIPYVRVERLWYERHFGAGGQNPAAMSAILDEMARHQGFAHITDLTGEQRLRANQSIGLRVSTWQEDNTGRALIGQEVHVFIGLPPGVTYQWDYPIASRETDEQPARYQGRCIVRLAALEPEGAPRQASEALMRQILDSLETDTGLTIDGAVRSQIIERGVLNAGLSRDQLAVTVPVRRNSLLAMFGEQQWAEFEARRAGGGG